jgi:hypothetical protein
MGPSTASAQLSTRSSCTVDSKAADSSARSILTVCDSRSISATAQPELTSQREHFAECSHAARSAQSAAACAERMLTTAPCPPPSVPPWLAPLPGP